MRRDSSISETASKSDLTESERHKKCWMESQKTEDLVPDCLVLSPRVTDLRPHTNASEVEPRTQVTFKSWLELPL